MGVGTILDARKLVLVASGQSKAKAIAQAVEGPVTSMVTASALQLHRDAIVIVDDEAAAGLTMRDYYEFIYAAKPAAPGRNSVHTVHREGTSRSTSLTPLRHHRQLDEPGVGLALIVHRP